MANQKQCSDKVQAEATNLRNYRYCEVIPVTQKGDTVTSWIYNTLGFNKCPEDDWKDLTVDEVIQEYSSIDAATIDAKLNGPRYWVIDTLTELESSGSESGSPSTGATFTFGDQEQGQGIEMALRATLATKPGEPTVGDDPWVPNQVQRCTVYTYKAGGLVYQLTTPEGDVYIMQSYSQQKEHLTIDELPSLEKSGKLTPPSGWIYSTHTLDEDLILESNGLATVINDNLYNSYQMRTD